MRQVHVPTTNTPTLSLRFTKKRHQQSRASSSGAHTYRMLRCAIDFTTRVLQSAVPSAIERPILAISRRWSIADPTVAMIIAFLNQKGGVGKTTLATHLAGELSVAGRSVVMVDADPQGSALDWSQKRAQSSLARIFSVIGLPRETLHLEIPDLAKRSDDVVIDGPPRVTALTRSAILAADLVVVPVQPSPYDVWASSEVVSLITEARIFKPDLRAIWVVNRAVVRTIIARDVRPALQRHGLSVLAATISQRVVFAESVASGRLAREIDPRSAAAREMALLAAELRDYLR